MPRQKHNIGRQRTKDFAVAKNGLLTKRADLLGEIITLDAARESKRLDIEAIDRVMRNVFDYTGDLDAIKPTGQRISHFRHGELGRMVMDVLRQSGRPLDLKEMTDIIAPKKGIDLSNEYDRKQLRDTISRACQRNEGRFIKRYVDAFGVRRWGV